MKLTPTEDLIMEVLAARARLGETIWTFEARHRSAMEKLESKGLVRSIHGVVESTIRASLTSHGRATYMLSDYEAPILKRYKLKKKYRV